MLLSMNILYVPLFLLVHRPSPLDDITSTEYSTAIKMFHFWSKKKKKRSQFNVCRFYCNLFLIFIFLNRHVSLS